MKKGGEVDDDGAGSGGEEREPLGPETLDEAIEHLEKMEENSHGLLNKAIKEKNLIPCPECNERDLPPAEARWFARGAITFRSCP